MSPEMEQSLIRVVKFASAHSQEHRLSDYTLGPLTNEQIFSIGTDLVRLFEERYKAEMKKAPPTKPGTPSGGSGGARVRQRLRDQ
jgi:hypothetical protein